MHKMIMVATVGAALLGCAAPAPSVRAINVPFDVARAKAMLQPGANTITGSALIRQRGGGVVTCAGSKVTLLPATEYAQQRVAAIYGSGHFASVGGGLKFTPDPAEFYQYTRTATCNAQGFFRFEGLSDGEFIVQTAIVWSIGRYSTEGGSVIARARVSGGQTVEVTLTP